MLHPGRAHEQIVDTIQVLSVEKTDLNSASTVNRALHNPDLRTECSPQFSLSGLDVRVDRARS